MRKYAPLRARARARNERTANGKDALVTCHTLLVIKYNDVLETHTSNHFEYVYKENLFVRNE